VALLRRAKDAFYSSEMTRPRPDLDPRSRGFLRAWVSGAMVWSAATRSLLAADGLGERYLAFVAFYLCLKESSLLVDGEGSGTVPGDPIARADCPIDPRALRKLRDRLRGFRDEILHLSDKSEEGRSLTTSWTTDRPFLVFRSSVGRSALAFDEISRPEVEGFLEQLDPWLRRHWERLIQEDAPGE
jgi:hypothetical protein